MKATEKQRWKVQFILSDKEINNHKLNAWMYELGQKEGGKKFYSDIITFLLMDNSKEEIEFYFKALGFKN